MRAHAFHLRKQLVNLRTLTGFSVQKGVLEVFPNPGEGSLGYGLRLPLQPGWARANANRKSDARRRITEAMINLKSMQRPFTTVELQKAAGCSRRTLYDHADIWRQDYEDLASGFFAICTD
ncbi:MAG TPA: hypothetical protein V6D08_15595 [Candidatus Obscuribacterales bacterium]